MKEHLQPAQKFDLANKNFKTVFRDKKRPHHNKYRFLHNWTLQKSKYLLNDEKAYRGNKKVFKRGAIVNVDFGVNVGTELSGNHFGIILNKIDGPSNDKLTVIPLTSHQHPHTIQLQNTLRVSAINLFSKRISDFKKLGAAIAYLRASVLNDPAHSPESSVEEFINIFPESTSDASLKPDLSDLTSAETARAIIKKTSPEINGNDDPISNNFINSVTKAVNDFSAVIDMYSRYNKTTFAKPLDITTISKTRLRKINYYDPIGDIVVDNETLNTIDSEICSLFIKNK